MIGLRVQVRGRWHSGDGTLRGLTAKTALVQLDGEDKSRRFHRKSVKPIRYRGQRAPWDETPSLAEEWR